MKKELKIAKRRSDIHGNGVIATAPIKKGEPIVEYKGKLITHDEADQQYHSDVSSGHTFLFTLNEEWIVDGNDQGNIARWINTGCDPNAIAFIHSEDKKKPDPKKDRVIIEALRNIETGEEIIYDYGFDFDVPLTPELLKAWECRCGSPKCTGSMLKKLGKDKKEKKGKKDTSTTLGELKKKKKKKDTSATLGELEKKKKKKKDKEKEKDTSASLGGLKITKDKKDKKEKKDKKRSKKEKKAKKKK